MRHRSLLQLYCVTCIACSDSEVVSVLGMCDEVVTNDVASFRGWAVEDLLPDDMTERIVPARAEGGAVDLVLTLERRGSADSVERTCPSPHEGYDEAYLRVPVRYALTASDGRLAMEASTNARFHDGQLVLDDEPGAGAATGTWGHGPLPDSIRVQITEYTGHPTFVLISGCNAGSLTGCDVVYADDPSYVDP